MKVTVLRGISGSGKTTWTKAHESKAHIVSADFYFMRDGVYTFDPQKLEENHAKCFRAFMEALLKSEEWIIVDNTNICAWEYSPYVLAAEAYGYAVELVTFECSVEVSLSRKDAVPPEKLRATSQRLEEEARRMPRRFKGIHRVISSC